MERKESDKSMHSKELAGKGSLDDEMLPNRGEPVRQEPEPRSEMTDAQGARKMQDEMRKSK